MLDPGYASEARANCGLDAGGWINEAGRDRFQKLMQPLSGLLKHGGGRTQGSSLGQEVRTAGLICLTPLAFVKHDA